MKKFEGKTAIVTGAGTGIGYAIAQSLVNAGANVVINDLDTTLVKNIESELGLKGLAGDMSSLDDIRSLVQFTKDHFGQIDLLVANAGLTHFVPFLEVKESDFDRVIHLNIKGTYFLTQLVAREMKDKGGKIVLMSSVLGSRAYPNLSVYSISKASINMMSRTLALDLAPYDININTIAPGAIATERTVQEVEDYHEKWANIIPTGRAGTIEDIAKTTLFLLSEDAKQINGQTICVDGGWSGLVINPMDS